MHINKLVLPFKSSIALVAEIGIINYSTLKLNKSVGSTLVLLNTVFYCMILLHPSENEGDETLYWTLPAFAGILLLILTGSFKAYKGLQIKSAVLLLIVAVIIFTNYYFGFYPQYNGSGYIPL